MVIPRNYMRLNVTDADLASVFDGSFQANEAVSSTPRSPQQEQSTDSKNN